MDRHRPRVRVLAASAGYSLVEVVLAMLISCIMVTAVMGVAVTARQGSGKSIHRMMFDQGISQLSAEVKQYVTACGCLKSTGACPSPGCTQIPGPNTNVAGVNTWNLNGAVGAGGTLLDSASYGGAGQNVWALSCGSPHVVTGVVPTLESSPYNGSITYNVTWPSGCTASLPLATDTPLITFTANWTEP